MAHAPAARDTANHNMSSGLAAFGGAAGNHFDTNRARNTIDGVDAWDEESLNTWEDYSRGTTEGI